MNILRNRLQETAGDPPAGSTPAAPEAPSAPSVEPAAQPESRSYEEPDYAQMVAEEEEDNNSLPSTEEGKPAEAPPTAPVVEAPPPAAAPVAPAPVVPPAPAPAPEPPSAPPSPEPGVASPQATAPPPATAPEPEARVEPVDFEKHRANFLPQLEKLYQLSSDEAEEVRVAPHEALPKLAARLHYEMQIATFNSMVQTIPKIVGKILVEREAQAESKRLFYARWPELGKKGEYTPVVENSLTAYRAANPKASFQEVVERAGIMACLSLGLNPLPTQAAPTPPAPVVPPKPAGAGASPSTPMRAAQPTGIEADIAEMVMQELEELRG